MWGLKKDIHVKKRPGDIVVDAAPGAPSHARSLRSYAEVLYLKVGDKVTPSLRIDLRDSPIVARDWQEYLVEMPNEYVLPKPNAVDVAAQFRAESTGRAAQASSREASATMTIGYARPMREIIAVLAGRKAHEEDEIAEEKGEIAVEETGFFVYHKGRMTRVLEKLKLQTAKSNAAQTSKLRITLAGEGLTGFVHETYLVQTHNKSGYLDSRLYDNLLTHANLKAKDFLRVFACRKHGQVCGYIPLGLVDVPPPRSEGASPGVKAVKEKPVVLEEEIRMRPLNPKDPTVGRVVKAPFSKGRYHLRRPDFTLSERSYLARDLIRTVFDPNKDVDTGMVAAPRAMAGVQAEVWWLPDHDGDAGEFWLATLRVPSVEWASPAVGGSRAGWFSLTYGDGFQEPFFIGLKPGDATIYAAYRDDGERLPGRIEFKIRDESSAQLTRVVELLRRTPQLATREEQAEASGAPPPAASSVLPGIASQRYAIFEAMCRGFTTRDAIVRRLRSWKRDSTVTVLGKEKKFKVPMWVQLGSSYQLTSEGREAALAAGLQVTASPSASSSTHVANEAYMVMETEVEVEAEIEAEVEVEADAEAEATDAEVEVAVDVQIGAEAGASRGELDVEAETAMDVEEVEVAVIEATEPVESIRPPPTVANPKVQPQSNMPLPLPATVPPSHAGANSKRKRCNACAGCLNKGDDCGVCVHCRDKRRFGGRGFLRKGCLGKACIAVIDSSPASAAMATNIAPTKELPVHGPALREPLAAEERRAPPSSTSAAPQPPSTSPAADEGPSAIPSAALLQPGARVKARYLASDPSVKPTAREREHGYGAWRWYEGCIREVHADGTFAVEYDDGETELAVLPKYIVPIESHDANDDTAPLALLASHSSHSSSHSNTNLTASHGSVEVGQAARRSSRCGPMTVRGALAVAEQAEARPWRVRAERDEALQRVASLESELAASHRAQSILREQLHSVMVQAAALHDGLKSSGNNEPHHLPHGHVDAVAALSQCTQRFLSGEGDDKGELLALDDDESGEVLTANVTEEELNEAILAVGPIELDVSGVSNDHMMLAGGSTADETEVADRTRVSEANGEVGVAGGKRAATTHAAWSNQPKKSKRS